LLIGEPKVGDGAVTGNRPAGKPHDGTDGDAGSTPAGSTLIIDVYYPPTMLADIARRMVEAMWRPYIDVDNTEFITHEDPNLGPTQIVHFSRDYCDWGVRRAERFASLPRRKDNP